MAVTFDFIFECWKKKNYPNDFNFELKKYLDQKIELFSKENFKFVSENHMTNWLSQILTVIEIGLEIKHSDFIWYRHYWENLLNRKWKVDIENKWVIWVD